MTYFSRFPLEVYDFSEFGEDKKEILVSDIITNVRVRTELLQNIVYYNEYDIREGETPEIISEKFYGTPLLHWAIMLINERYDYLQDFPLSLVNLEAYINDKYGVANIDNIHHYQDSTGQWVNSDYINPAGIADAIPITNYEYEVTLNEDKRRIKIVPPEIMSEVLRKFREILK
jgi:hypothetical protein